MTPVSAMRLALAISFFASLFLAITMYYLSTYRYGITTNFGSDITYNAGTVKKLATNADAAAGYVFPILFPLDLLFLATFGAFLALASIQCAAPAGIPTVWIWILIILPAVYMAADFSENIFLARMVSDPDSISDHAVAITQTMTQLKLTCGALASLQAAGLFMVAVIRRLV